MTVLVEPFASVYDDGSRIGVILARGRRGFEAYVADDYSLGLFPSPRKAAAAITTTRPWVAQTTARQGCAAGSDLRITKGGTSCDPLFAQSQRLHWLFG
jgi:hypothetical protein